MMRTGWSVAIAMLLGLSSVALAEDVKPTPGIEMSLEERTCAVIECDVVYALPQRRITPKEFKGWRSLLHPGRPDYLLRFHYQLLAELRAKKVALDALNARLAACEAENR